MGGVSLYGWLWRRLPGRWPLKVVILALLAAAVCVLLFLVVFPWIEPRLPFNHVTVNSPGGGG
jgi:hypothetical protein